MSEPARPARRRGTAVDRAVLAAALEELAEVGFDRASVTGVAERAGVHKTTVYRRFPTRANLFVEALVIGSEGRVPVPDTGSLRVDLVTLLRLVCGAVDAPLGLALLRTSTLAGSERYAEERRRFWSERLTAFLPIFDRAVARGELPAGVDAPLVLEMLVAPVHSRLLVTGLPVDETLPERVVDLLLAGLLTPAVPEIIPKLG